MPNMALICIAAMQGFCASSMQNWRNATTCMFLYGAGTVLTISNKVTLLVRGAWSSRRVRPDPVGHTNRCLDGHHLRLSDQTHHPGSTRARAMGPPGVAHFSIPKEFVQ